MKIVKTEEIFEELGEIQMNDMDAKIVDIDKIMQAKINQLEELASSENSEGRWREEEKYLFAKECLEEILDTVHQQTSEAMAEIRKLNSQRRIELEDAFRRGMHAGYGIDHENIHEEEDAAVEEFMRKYSKEKYNGN